MSIKKLFRSYRGRHFTSRWVRRVFERSKIRVLVGYHLAIVFVAFSLIEPQAHAFVMQQNLSSIPPNEIVSESEITTETTLSWPVEKPRITQGYRFGHWGLDIQDKDKEKNIYPVDKGWVVDVIHTNWGYGKHVYVQHPNGRYSLYAHMRSINVEKGETVTRDTVLGEMGRTGWATGVHLHLEVFQDGKRINPSSILPDLD